MMRRKVFSLTKLFPLWMLCHCIGGYSTREPEVKLTRNIFTTTTPLTPSSTEQTETTTAIDTYAYRLIKNRERKKEERLQMIKDDILKRLGIKNQQNITSSLPTNKRRIIGHFNKSINKPASHSRFPEYDDYAKRFQSFYASCSIPKNRVKEEWENPSFYRIYFDLAPHSSRSTVYTAKLHLYKYGNGGISTPLSVVTNPSPIKKKYFIHRVEFLDLQESEPEKFRVSLYQYRKAVKSKSNKKLDMKLVDSQMINANYEGWIEFNVKSSVKDWLQNNNKNFGLEVVMENSDGENQDTPNLFTKMNCSDHEVPFPTFAIEESSGNNDNDTSLPDNETYPRLDLMTIELPDNLPLKRQKRQVFCSPIKERKGECCTESMYITFKELGFEELIIAPTGFYTSYCMGSCKLRKQSILNSVLPKMSSRFQQNVNGGCVPRFVRPLKITYIDQYDQQKYLTLDNVVVSKCGCVG